MSPIEPDYLMRLYTKSETAEREYRQRQRRAKWVFFVVLLPALIAALLFAWAVLSWVFRDEVPAGPAEGPVRPLMEQRGPSLKAGEYKLDANGRMERFSF